MSRSQSQSGETASKDSPRQRLMGGQRASRSLVLVERNVEDGRHRYQRVDRGARKSFTVSDVRLRGFKTTSTLGSRSFRPGRKASPPLAEHALSRRTSLSCSGVEHVFRRARHAGEQMSSAVHALSDRLETLRLPKKYEHSLRETLSPTPGIQALASSPSAERKALESILSSRLLAIAYAGRSPRDGTRRRLDADGSHGRRHSRRHQELGPCETGPTRPDVIFAGPPCEHYSSARTRAKTPRNLKLADSLVRKTVEIIEHFHAANPRLQFFVENPDTSMLWKRWVSHRLYGDVSRHYVSAFVAQMNGVRGRKTHRDVIRSRRKAFGIGCDDSRGSGSTTARTHQLQEKDPLMTNSLSKAPFAKGSALGSRWQARGSRQRGP
ncbi:hypothetical protein Q5P01_001014 [Channa striata]|uniref:Uncharacterized protein n=1 Tax=Channa striata TaxID=64152 RepID=A0AA88IH35_CHASR|nr:hypothetical protein Q5P01_001014 [Channa striata]